MNRSYREYESFEKVIYVEDNYWECGFYNRSGTRDEHYLIGIMYGVHRDQMLPYNEHTKQYVGKPFTGEETADDI